MPALPGYIPARDADLANWSANFSTLLTASPATYGLMAGDAAAVAAVQATWAAAYSAAVNPATRTPVQISAKNAAKIALLATCRPYAQTVALNAGVTQGNKVALGVNPRTSVPTPITQPTTNPVISIISAPPLQHILAFRDQMASPSVKAKPYGVVAVQLFGVAGSAAVTTPATMTLVATLTKSPALINWGDATPGQIASYLARWVTRKGLVGPWSTPVHYTIAG